ncbi:hypothetical protein SBC1_47530 (plasmid) [Caballeronia sp. SBC1]|nr:hypothetical protein SBC2_40440 [Caballeronia sp. SBC2]QIN64713.1 hypothetical protein SBC1_47530 [Caballeronia sp. SBC1]
MSDRARFHSGMSIEIARSRFSGRMGSAASRSSGLPATTYNAAGLNAATTARYGNTPATSVIRAIHADKEVLTSVPRAVGTSYTVPGHGNTPNRHGMDQVIDGIEAQTRHADTKLTEALTHG